MHANDFKLRLQALGWTQADAARHLDVSTPFVSLIAGGKKPIPPSIAAALDAAVDAKLAAVRGAV